MCPNNLIGAVDAYGYWPLVRQVFVQRVSRPRRGEPTDEAELAKGLTGSAKVLAALERLAADATFIVGPALSLADLHLGAMIAYFAQAAEGDVALKQHARLAAWWQKLRHRPSFSATDPGLP